MILWSKCKIVQNYMIEEKLKLRLKKLNMTRGKHFEDLKIFEIKILVRSVTASIPRVRENAFCVSFIENTRIWLDNLYYLAWVPEGYRVFL